MKNNKGYGLIELVFVVVVLAILATTALPRFMDVTSEAKVVTLQNSANSVESAITIATELHGRSVVLGDASPMVNESNVDDLVDTGLEYSDKIIPEKGLFFFGGNLEADNCHIIVDLKADPNYDNTEKRVMAVTHGC